MKKLCLAPMLALLLVGAAAHARADGQDMVKLKDGAVLFGTITEDNEDAVIILSNGVSRRISRGMVLRTQFAGGEPSQAAQAAPEAVPVEQAPVEQAPVDAIPSETEYVGGISAYYGVPEDQVAYVQQAGIPAEELPVLFLLSRRHHLGYRMLCDLRLSGLSWYDIMFRYNLGPDVFWFDMGGPLPGDDPNYFLYRPRREWRHMHMSDEDIIHSANIGYVSSYRHIPPSRLIAVSQVGGHPQHAWGAFHPADPSHAPHFSQALPAHAALGPHPGPAGNVSQPTGFHKGSTAHPALAPHAKPKHANQPKPHHQPQPKPAAQHHSSETKPAQGGDKGGDHGNGDGHHDH
jgi:hypothetical protein